MNLAIFTQCYLPTLNGVVIAIENYRKEFERLGHKVYVFAPAYPGYQDKSERVFRVKAIKTLFNLDYPLVIFPSAELQAQFQQIRPHIVHTQHPFLLCKYGVKLAKRYNIPVVFTCHTLLEKYAHYIPFFRSVREKWMISVSRNYSNFCDCVIVSTPSVKELLRSYGVTTRIEVIPIGVDIEKMGSGDPTIIKDYYSLPDDTTILLFVGRLAKEKNSDFLLKAFQQIVKAEPHTHLLLVGGGPWGKYCKGLAKALKVDKQVTFAGFWPAGEVKHFYACADIFVFPSVTETLGLVAIEAMAAGVPPVAINAFGLGDVIEDGKDGLLTADSLDDFSAKVVKLLRNKELRQRLSQNAKLSAQKFGITESAKKLLAVYEDLIRH